MLYLNINTDNKSIAIYKQLKSEIINLQYNLDDILLEQVIAKRFGVSKTPVREALAALVQDGYLIKIPRRGYFVKDLRIDEYYEIVQLRFVLESGIIRIIIANCTDEEIASLYDFLTETEIEYHEYHDVNKKFHMAMAALTKNRYICDSLKKVFDINHRGLAVEYFKTARHDIHKDHRVIVETLKERNTDKAIELIRQELRRCDDEGSWF